jgi:glutathione S-transferase
MALLSAGVPVELREVELKHKPQGMLDASDKGSVPVLVLPNGNVIDESLDIMRWALQQGDPLGWLELDGGYSHLITQNDGEFKHALDRYKYISRYPEDAEKDWRAECEKFFAELECVLTKQAFLGGAVPRIPDYAIFPFVRQSRIPDEQWFDTQMAYPHVRKWLKDLVQSELFVVAMKKQAAWAENSPAVILEK